MNYQDAVAAGYIEEKNDQVPQKAIDAATEFMEREWIDNGVVLRTIEANPEFTETAALEALGEQYKGLIEAQAREMAHEDPMEYYGEPEEPYESPWAIP